MSYVEYFQKCKKNFLNVRLHLIYKKLFVRNNSQRIKYLVEAGADIGDNVTIDAVGMLGSEPWLVHIGNNTFFSGAETQLITHDGAIMQLYYMGLTDKIYDVFSEIHIGDNCFIGNRSIILKGTNIGANCIIGAGSVVTKDIPEGSVACGVPARVIGTTKEFYKKNITNFVDTYGLSAYEKRKIYEREKKY